MATRDMRTHDGSLHHGLLMMAYQPSFGWYRLRPGPAGERVCAAGIYTAWTEPGAPGW